MDRRSFLKSSAVGGGAVAAGGLAAPAVSQGKVRLTMVTTWGRGLAGVHDSAVFCAEHIRDLSDGQMEVELNAAGELVGAFEVFDAVSSGQADMYHGAEYYFLNQHPAYAFFSTVPFGMTVTELNDWYYHNGGQELHEELGEIFNLKTFLAGNTGTQAGGWFRKEIRSVEDFKGLKFRAPGLGGEAFSNLGASVQNIPGAEVYQALSSGAIDATEWIGPWADEKAGFYEITKLYYTAGPHEPGPAQSLATNREVFENLTRSQQKIIETTAMASNQWVNNLFHSNNAAALDRLQREGVELKDFPDDVWTAFGPATEEALGRYMDDEMFKRVRKSYSESLRKSASWYAESAGAFADQRDRVLGI